MNKAKTVVFFFYYLANKKYGYQFQFTCNHCSKKSFCDFYRFSHPDVILLLNELIQALDNIIDILMNYVNH